jgi:hypothetical protein
MSEFDTHEPAAGQDPQTRLKFERYVFFAFFAVMVMVVIAGIVEIKRSQQTLEDSHADSARLREAANKAALRADRERKEAEISLEVARTRQTGAEDREERRSVELGAALTQLALFESDKGPAARARARQLLDEAARLGPPPYIDLARWALLDASRPGPAPIERTPFICAAVSPDGQLLAIGRGERGIDIVQISSGRKLTTLANPEAAGEATALAFGPSALFCGYRGGQVAKAVLGIENPTSEVVAFAKMSGAIKFLSASAAGRHVATSDTSDNVRVCHCDTPTTVLVEGHCDGHLLTVLATDNSKQPLLTLDETGHVRRVSPGNKSEVIWAKGAREELPFTRGSMGLIGENIQVALYEPATKYLFTCQSLTPPTSMAGGQLEEPGCISFALDGTLLVGDKAGSFHEFYSNADDFAHGISLGSDSPLRFVARAENFVIGISADGTVSVRFDPEAALNGRRILRVGSAIATSHGLADASRGYAWPSGIGIWMSTSPCDKLLPTPAGYAAFSVDTVRLDTGAQAKGEVLICAFSSGAAMLRSMTGDVSMLGRDGKSTPVPQVARLAPDFVCVAAQSDVVLARTSNSALVIRLENGVSVREIFSPGMPMLGAIDEHGKRVALPDRDSIRILMLEGSGEVQAYPRGELKSLAFLFDGSILCTLEGKDLAFYDSASGRELLRRPTLATYMSGAQDRLFLVCPDELRELRLR